MIDVKSGWHEGKESNTVTYDPDRITIKEMVRALQKRHTYIGTME